MRSGDIIEEILENEDILLDGAKIIGCTLEDCRLIFWGNEGFILSNNRLNRCSVHLRGSAALTVEVLEGLQQSGFSLGINFQQLNLN